LSQTYRVAAVYPTVQGEGALTGTPVVLLRLQGCAVGCPWCDTKETWGHAGGSALTAAEVVARVDALASGGSEWVLLTGGEPAEQDLRTLVIALRAAGLRVMLETSGTADGCLGLAFDWLCVSPKPDMPGGRPLIPAVLAEADEIKMVIGKPADVEQLDRVLALLPHHLRLKVTSLQPLSGSRKATELCVETAKARGWRLSVQTHKVIGLP
jgi:7-carboxy-7-deazaguanine synthase